VIEDWEQSEEENFATMNADRLAEGDLDLTAGL